MDLHTIISDLARVRPVFHNEADFQHALAWAIHKHYPDAKIRLEMKIHGPDTKVYADILASIAGRKYAIELKYKTRTLHVVIDGEEFSLSNHGAQDIGRYDVLKDVQRLEQMVASGGVDEGFLVFLTNDSSYYSHPGEVKVTADQDFRLHEGRRVQGTLSWGEHTGQGTMKGREEPLTLQGQYDLHWTAYSHLADKIGGEFHYLMLPVRDIQTDVNKAARPFAQVISDTRTADDVLITNQATIRQRDSMPWYELFSQRGEIPLSQADLRDKLANHLREAGYSVSVNRNLGRDTIDIWAERGHETLAIEVRNKTALLQTMYQGKFIHLKNQAAQDVSRYDFIRDIAKLERVVSRRPDVKGYALLVTNDAMYWKPPKKSNSVDHDFRIHDGRLLTGTCTWTEEAAPGTTSGREEPIGLTGTYILRWRPYLKLGAGRNMEFQALIVEVANCVNHGVAFSSKREGNCPSVS
ncbi:MAG: hypothetical protein K6T81_02660 [Alicyclobacillus macrosporangiidus]|uniref:hypothetical protein n=1 Tax=Alicyclobacillus macrosporangiidus TaxID=392015 RepID=UPI0026EC52D6|nr:hypothetical protein [Alicyclobacillus macrosporangiidus]MCL6597626.1 hypothetical protein [Alicyclobacillus macrosporangiidus]